MEKYIFSQSDKVRLISLPKGTPPYCVRYLQQIGSLDLRNCDTDTYKVYFEDGVMLRVTNENIIPILWFQPTDIEKLETLQSILENGESLETYQIEEIINTLRQYHNSQVMVVNMLIDFEELGMQPTTLTVDNGNTIVITWRKYLFGGDAE